MEDAPYRLSRLSTQHYLYGFCGALSLAAAISYFYSGNFIMASAHVAGTVTWTAMTFGGVKGERPKWFNFVALPAITTFLVLIASSVWSRA